MGVFCCCVQHIRLRRRVPQLENVLKLLTENSEKSINKTNMLEDKLKKVMSRISTLPDINYLNGCFDEMEKSKVSQTSTDVMEETTPMSVRPVADTEETTPMYV